MNTEKCLTKHKIPFLPDLNKDVIFIIRDKAIYQRDENGKDVTRIRVSMAEF